MKYHASLIYNRNIICYDAGMIRIRFSKLSLWQKILFILFFPFVIIYLIIAEAEERKRKMNPEERQLEELRDTQETIYNSNSKNWE